MIRPASKEDIGQIAAMYLVCFAEAPWFEVYDLEEVMREMEEWLRNSRATLLVEVVDGRVRGAALGFPAALKSDVLEVTGQGFDRAYYVSELFVAPEFRRQGIVRRLTEELLSRARAEYAYALVRTSRQQPAILKLFQEHYSFETLATPDTRVIMGGPIG